MSLKNWQKESLELLLNPISWLSDVSVSDVMCRAQKHQDWDYGSECYVLQLEQTSVGAAQEFVLKHVWKAKAWREDQVRMVLRDFIVATGVIL